MKTILFTIIALLIIGLATIIKNREDVISDLKNDNFEKDITIHEKDSLLLECSKIKIEHIEKCLQGSEEIAMKKLYKGEYYGKEFKSGSLK